MDPRITSIAQRFAELSRELEQIVGTPLAAPAPVEQGQSVMENEPIMTASEVSALVRVHLRTLRRWAHEGIFPRPIRIGRTVRWRRTDIDDWIREQKT